MKQPHYRKRFSNRIGKSSLDVVMATAIMVPAAAFAFINGVKICKYVYATIANAACWPFM